LVKNKIALENNLLDYNEERKKSELFTRITLLCAIIALGCFAEMIHALSGLIEPTKDLNPPMVLVRLTQIMTLTSIVTLLISFRKKEPRTWKTWLACILSVGLFSLMFGTIALHLILE